MGNEAGFFAGFLTGMVVCIALAVGHGDWRSNDCKQKYDTYKCISVLLPHDHPEVLKNEDH